MKVYFSASHKGKSIFNEYYQIIYKELPSLGFKHLNNSIQINEREYYGSLDKAGAVGYREEYQRVIHGIKETDIVVLECSFPSFGMGYMVQKALEMNKPVIALYLEEHTPNFLIGIDNEKFQLVEYTKDNLLKKLKEAVEHALDLREKRFNFFINPDLLTYLEEASKKEGLTKSTFIRNLITEHRNKHTK